MSRKKKLMGTNNRVVIAWKWEWREVDDSVGVTENTGSATCHNKHQTFEIGAGATGNVY